MSGHSRAVLEAKAKARWEAARLAFDSQATAEGWVHLLAMGMDLAAVTREPLKNDELSKIARAAGLIT
jgi:hypothetical protein